MVVEEVVERSRRVIGGWGEPPDASAALAYRRLAEAVTGVECPLPVEPDEVERRVAVARRNREYSAAHTDAMLPRDPPILPDLLTHAEALDARERGAFADRLAERERRLALDPGEAEAADLRLATVLRGLVLGLEPERAAVLCLRYGLNGDRPRRPDEVARTLGMDPEAVRRHEADALADLRATDAAVALRDVLDAQ